MVLAYVGAAASATKHATSITAPAGTQVGDLQVARRSGTTGSTTGWTAVGGFLWREVVALPANPAFGGIMWVFRDAEISQVSTLISDAQVGATDEPQVVESLTPSRAPAYLIGFGDIDYGTVIKPTEMSESAVTSGDLSNSFGQIRGAHQALASADPTGTRTWYLNSGSGQTAGRVQNLIVLQANMPPTAPTLVAPAADARVSAPVFDWTHNDPDGDAQARFALVRKKVAL